MTAHNIAIAAICWCLLSVIVGAGWVCWREAVEKRRKPDPNGRDLRAMSTWEASAVLAMEDFFRDWDALVEKERQS